MGEFKKACSLILIVNSIHIIPWSDLEWNEWIPSYDHYNKRMSDFVSSYFFHTVTHNFPFVYIFLFLNCMLCWLLLLNLVRIIFAGCMALIFILMAFSFLIWRTFLHLAFIFSSVKFHRSWQTELVKIIYGFILFLRLIPK